MLEYRGGHALVFVHRKLEEKLVCSTALYGVLFWGIPYLCVKRNGGRSMQLMIMQWRKYLLFVNLLVVTNVYGFVSFAEQRSITVQGSGTISAPADQATVHVGVSHTAKTASEAMEKTSENMNALFSLLDRLSISEKDRQTQNLSLYPTQELSLIHI